LFWAFLKFEYFTPSPRSGLFGWFYHTLQMAAFANFMPRQTPAFLNKKDKNVTL